MTALSNCLVCKKHCWGVHGIYFLGVSFWVRNLDSCIRKLFIGSKTSFLAWRSLFLSSKLHLGNHETEALVFIGMSDGEPPNHDKWKRGRRRSLHGLRFNRPSRSSLKLVAQCLGSLGSMNLSFSRIKTVKTQFSASRRALTVQAGYSDGRTPGSADIFIGGFVLGGIVVGALGCAYARTSENA
ncbi:uncharacterized protein LOC130786582 isoform X2 [Actinidia eriantha]|uniref:uncharacterized protein LOC130786582 isoform X2 n=1 Tax=Actinidia eriantha TaxID=165200 RepID=UPI002582AC93|nr:uncharacterized protein LOC130786582 isoform X2 [Actinidia eriantha]